MTKDLFLVKFNLVLFVERAGELRGVARLSILDAEPKRKRVLNGRHSCIA